MRYPNMNAYAERFVRSIRQEVLDHFILSSEKQIKKIVNEYVNDYNKYRPHKCPGDISDKYVNVNSGKVVCPDVLSGLHPHYYRSTA
jgi:hypothetical protein